jgi:Immunity protein Imm1
MVTLSVGGSVHSAASAVRDEAGLLAVLQPADEQVPTAFQLRLEPRLRGQPALMVGLHGECGVLWWSDPANDESLVAVGGCNVEEVQYYIGTADFEFPPHSELSRVEVLAAATEFLVTGRRPTELTWMDADDAFADAS